MRTQKTNATQTFGQAIYIPTKEKNYIQSAIGRRKSEKLLSKIDYAAQQIKAKGFLNFTKAKASGDNIILVGSHVSSEGVKPAYINLNKDAKLENISDSFVQLGQRLNILEAHTL